MFEAAFMQRAIAAGLLVSLLLSLLGFFVVLRRMSFIGVGIEHAAFGGVGLAAFLNAPIFLIASLFSIATGLGIGLITRKGLVREDTSIGILSAAGMATGVLFLALKKGYASDAISYLFGSILAVTGLDLWLIAGVALAVLLLLFLFFKEFLASSFDPELARASGLPEGFLYYLLLAMTGLSIVAAIKIVGVILVSALLVLPTATARQWSQNYRVVLVLSLVFGIASTFSGLVASYWLDIPSGATIVIFATAAFVISLVLSPQRRRTRANTMPVSRQG